MLITVKDGKKEITVNCESYFDDGTHIDFENPDHDKRFRASVIRGMERAGYQYAGDENDTVEA